ncbi:MAG: DegV family protein [Lachnospiraceae bacterium]|nr:DegV family protein [Lachnospiraceae bacterium]
MIRILSDSTCDFSPELTEKNNIEIIPLHVYLGEEEYLDGVSINPEKLYEWSDATGSTPRTSAPTPDEVEHIFKKYIDQGDELIVFTISSLMSASYNVCKLAAESLNASDRILVVDSTNLTTGIGHLMLEAKELIDEGKDLKTIGEEIQKLKPLLRSSFVVDTLVYLSRGGRCSGLAAMLGSVLKLHPRIVVENGAMHSDKKYRGSLDKAVLKYAEDLTPALLKARPKRVFITHSGCSEEIISGVKKLLENLNHFNEIHVTKTGCVVSSHCGPGTLGILYMD